jgi:hypothetical protein
VLLQRHSSHFPPLGQRIVLITESPYNFPREDCKTLRDFLEKDFWGSIKRIQEAEERERRVEKERLRMPHDIFDFIYSTFNPVFSKSLKEENVERFVKRVYWTHAAKKSLKGYSKSNASKL